MIIVFKGLKSYTIAYSNITSNDLSHLVSKKDIFSSVAMKTAYGTLLTGLLVIYEHDCVADQAAKEFNVGCSRNTPFMVYMINEMNNSYITFDMDHRMGMNVAGESKNVYSFRMACSFSFSSVEQLIGTNVWNTSSISSVNLGILENITPGDSLVSYYNNGYLVVYNAEREFFTGYFLR